MGEATSTEHSNNYHGWRAFFIASALASSGIFLVTLGVSFGSPVAHTLKTLFHVGLITAGIFLVVTAIAYFVVQLNEHY